MAGDDGLRSEAVAANGPRVEHGGSTQPLTLYGLGARLGDLAIFFVAIIGAVALGLGISDYLAEHTYVVAYLFGYAGFRLADALLRAEQPSLERDTRGPRWANELPILMLFVAAPFERTYIYGGEAPDSLAAFGLLMELAGLWLVIGARIQLRFGAGLEGRIVVRSGFYRHIRHPVYAGACLVLFAWPFEFGAPVVAGITLATLLLVTRRRIRKEEAGMLARFGEQYESYMRETDSLIPSLW